VLQESGSQYSLEELDINRYYAQFEPELSQRLIRLIHANWLEQMDKPLRTRKPLAETSFPIYAASETEASIAGLTPHELDRWILDSTFCKLLLPATTQIDWVVQKDLANEAVLLAALRLSQFRAKHGSMQDNQSELEATLLAEAPIDPCGSGGTIRSSRLANGVRLWSIGPDGVDNDGTYRAGTHDGSSGDIVIELRDRQHAPEAAGDQ
jgi:hypothetical protein